MEAEHRTKVPTSPVLANSEKKQAVVVVHGMGEQLPMTTLRSFVETAWDTNPELTDITEKTSWIKPDGKAGSEELKRITTSKGLINKRTDFFEFYWADLMQGTTLQHLTAWVQGLLFRSPLTVPRDVFFVWMVLWGTVLLISVFMTLWLLRVTDTSDALCKVTILEATCSFLRQASIEHHLDWLGELTVFGVSLRDILVGIPALIFAVVFRPRGGFSDWRRWGGLIPYALIIITLVVVTDLVIQNRGMSLVLSLISGYFINKYLVKYFGDVARYVQATPENVHKRKAIRDRGLALLQRLQDSGDYDRIVVVSHSLGSIVAYDILNQFWNVAGPSSSRPPTKKTMGLMQLMADKLNEWSGNTNRPHAEKMKLQGEFRNLQRNISLSLGRQQKNKWLITDFVTLGSPLTHAEFLVAKDESSFIKLLQERSIPSVPPIFEHKDQGRYPSFIYGDADGDDGLPHHASVFSAVRWTNIYDKHRWLLFLSGDVISGPVGNLFGDTLWIGDSKHRVNGKKIFPAIRDVRVEIKRPNSFFDRLFTHNDYWTWRESYKNKDNLPTHIREFRKAVNLLDEYDV